MDTISSSDSTQPSNSLSVSLILTFCLVSVLLIFLVYSNNFVFGSKPGNWTYPYFKTIKEIPTWILIAIITLLGLTIFIGKKLIFSYEKIALVLCFLSALLLQNLIHRAYPLALGSIVQSDTANSFYSTAMHYSPAEILSQYIQLAPSFPLHAKTNMPGKILLYQFLELLTASPQMLAYLVIGLSTIGGLLMYGICKILFHDRLAAFYAFILYALVPAKLAFFPILNTVTPIFILICFYLFLLYLERKQARFLWLLGIAIYILILFEPSPLVTGILFVGILLSAIREKRFSMKDFWQLLALPVLAFASVYLLFLILFSFNLFQVVQYVLNDAVQFNTVDHRDYWIWVGENPKEFFMDVGLPIMMIFIFLLTQLVTQIKRVKDAFAPWPVENVLVVSLFVTLCTVIFLGINRGEVTRLWIYLAVFFQIPAAFFLARLPRSSLLFFIVACTLVAQTMIALQRVGFIIL